MYVHKLKHLPFLYWRLSQWRWNTHSPKPGNALLTWRPCRQARHCLDHGLLSSSASAKVSLGWSNPLILHVEVFTPKRRKHQHIWWKYHNFICIKHIVPALLTFLWGSTFIIKMFKRVLGWGRHFKNEEHALRDGLEICRGRWLLSLLERHWHQHLRGGTQRCYTSCNAWDVFPTWKTQKSHWELVYKNILSLVAWAQQLWWLSIAMLIIELRCEKREDCTLLCS